jgi:hypothetical protein
LVLDSSATLALVLSSSLMLIARVCLLLLSAEAPSARARQA